MSGIFRLPFCLSFIHIRHQQILAYCAVWATAKGRCRRSQSLDRDSKQTPFWIQALVVTAEQQDLLRSGGLWFHLLSVRIPRWSSRRWPSLSCFSLITPGNCSDDILKQNRIASFNNDPNSSLRKVPSFSRTPFFSSFINCLPRSLTDKGQKLTIHKK